MGFRPEDIASAGRLTTDPASPVGVPVLEPLTLTPPVSNPKAVRLYCEFARIFVETSPAGESPDDPSEDGSLVVNSQESEYIPLEPGGSVRIAVDARSTPPNPCPVRVTWLS